VKAQAYLEKIRANLASSAAIKQVTVVQEYALLDRGFFRARLTLTTDDFVSMKIPTLSQAAPSAFWIW
jgi:hypothetical protein